MEMIEKYPKKPWNWYEISCNPNISIEMIEKYPDKPWNISATKFTKENSNLSDE
jgi:hypothetical protein